MAEQRKRWIGDSYEWPVCGSRTRLAGYFADDDNDGSGVVLTMMPREKNCCGEQEAGSGLVCIVPLVEMGIEWDLWRNQVDVISRIAKDPISFGARCTFFADGEPHEGKIVGTHRFILLDGRICPGLYELETRASLHGMAGAPVICEGKLLRGVVVGHTNNEENGMRRAFVADVSHLHARLNLMSPHSVKDTKKVQLFYKNVAEFAADDSVVGATALLDNGEGA